MAGHNFSGYISGLWQALFAVFIQLFTRSSRSPSSNHNPDTTTSSKAQPAPSAGDDQESQSFAPDLERGSQEDTKDSTDDDDDDAAAAAMAAYKKRGGQKRTGVKANAAAAPSPSPSHDKENIGPGTQPSQVPVATSPGANDNSATPLNSSNQATVSTAGDKDAANKRHQPPTNTAGPKASGRKAPLQQPTGCATSKDTTTPRSENMAATQMPEPTAVVPAETQPEIQRAIQNAGSGSQASTQATDAISATVPTVSLPASTAPARQAAANAPATAALPKSSAGDVIAAPLNDDKPLDKNSAAVEAAAVPTVPPPTILMAGGLTAPQLTALKPLAPLVTPPSQVLPGLVEPDTEEGKREREIHLKFMREALAMGELALSINETPVGCVLVYKNRTIAKGMNATNVTRNGTRHAEFMALSALLSHQPDADVKDESAMDESLWGDVDPSDGHIFPYGQKLHPSPKVNRSIIEECVLYVTVEPCVMCASLLRQLGIKKVFFGAVNDKFGGTGGVFRIHVNSKPAQPKSKDDRPYQNGYGPHDMEHVHRGKPGLIPRDDDDGDGGNVERGYPAEGGYLRDEAVSLLRRFYVQENGRAPQPRKKEGRAARLYAMESAAANGGSFSDTDVVTPAEALVQTPATEELQKDPNPVVA